MNSSDDRAVPVAPRQRVPSAPTAPAIRWRRRRQARAFPTPFMVGLLLSLLVHAAALTLNRAGDGEGWPGWVLPWQERRVEVPALRIRLQPLPGGASVSTPAAANESVAERPAVAWAAPPVHAGLQAVPAQQQGAPTFSPTAPASKVDAPDGDQGVALAPKPVESAVPAETGPAPEMLTEAAWAADTRAAAVALPVPSAGPAALTPPTVGPAAAAVSGAAMVIQPSDGTALAIQERPPVEPLQRKTEAMVRDHLAPAAAWARPAPPSEPSLQQDRVEEKDELLQALQTRQEAARIETLQAEAARVEAAWREAQRQSRETQDSAMEAQQRAEQQAKQQAEQQAALTRQEAAQRQALLQAAQLQAALTEAEQMRAAQLAAEQQATAREALVRQAAERLEAERQALARQDAQQAAARKAAAEKEVERQKVAQLETLQEAARQEAMRQEAVRQAAALQAAAQRELERQAQLQADAARQEAARLAAAQRAAAQAEQARLEQVRQEQARLERDRQAQAEIVRQEAARQAAILRMAELQASERARAAAQAQAAAAVAQAAAAAATAAEAAQARTTTQTPTAAAASAANRAEAPQLPNATQQQAAEEQAAAAQREARLQAIGRQLNEEADRREAAAAASARDPSASRLRRGRLFGRTDNNPELIRYAEAWARKIEKNMTIDMVREATQQRHGQPVVTVAIRSDGTVESVTIVQTSGVAALDATIPRIVHSQANYPPFPPALAAEFDVIEIRRTWHFDVAVRLY